MDRQKELPKKRYGNSNQRSERVIPHAEEDERGLGEDLEKRGNCGGGEGHGVRFLLLLFLSEVFRVTHSEIFQGMVFQTEFVNMKISNGVHVVVVSLSFKYKAFSFLFSLSLSLSLTHFQIIKYILSSVRWAPSSLIRLSALFTQPALEVPRRRSLLNLPIRDHQSKTNRVHTQNDPTKQSDDIHHGYFARHAKLFKAFRG